MNFVSHELEKKLAPGAVLEQLKLTIVADLPPWFGRASKFSDQTFHALT